MEAISHWWQHLIANLHWWSVVGYVGQCMFFTRFGVQWIASERKKQSIIPISFWYWSIFGSLLLLVYSVGQVDPVFVLGQSLNSLVYLRNLMLIRNRKPEPHGLAIK
jgi:lipid-A-disaccharide synthase-like uncharacterized protein